jgi:hypothetical protein
MRLKSFECLLSSTEDRQHEELLRELWKFTEVEWPVKCQCNPESSCPCWENTISLCDDENYGGPQNGLSGTPCQHPERRRREDLVIACSVDKTNNP